MPNVVLTIRPPSATLIVFDSREDRNSLVNGDRLVRRNEDRFIGLTVKF